MGGAMDFVRAIFGGLAGDAIFWIVDKQFLTLAPLYQVLAIILVFVICAVGFWLARGKIKSGLRLLSGNRFKGGMTATLERASIDAKGGGADVLSGNKVSGPTTVEIKDTTIKS
jgi:hypothetical protein